MSDIKKYNYTIKKLSYINENINHFINYANLAHKRFKFSFEKLFENSSSTLLYHKYNMACLTFGSKLYNRMFLDLQKIAREFSNTKEELWFQSWLNFHKQDQVLNWHNHYCQFHGYISIDPKNTETQFENYTIKNEIGNLYIGEPNKHRVNVLSPYKGNRITIAFDVVSEKQILEIYDKYGNVDVNVGFIPLIK